MSFQDDRDSYWPASQEKYRGPSSIVLDEPPHDGPADDVCFCDRMGDLSLVSDGLMDAGGSVGTRFDDETGHYVDSGGRYSSTSGHYLDVVDDNDSYSSDDRCVFTRPDDHFDSVSGMAAGCYAEGLGCVNDRSNSVGGHHAWCCHDIGTGDADTQDEGALPEDHKESPEQQGPAHRDARRPGRAGLHRPYEQIPWDGVDMPIPTHNGVSEYDGPPNTESGL